MSNNDFKISSWELIKKRREKLGQGIVDKFDKCGCCFVVDDEQGVWMCNNNHQRPCVPCACCVPPLNTPTMSSTFHAPLHNQHHQ